MRPISSSKLKPVLERISHLTSKDLDKLNAWKGLADLSQKTILTGVEAHPSGVYQIGQDKFEAVATVFLTLNFAKGGKKAFANSFPAHIVGTVNPDNNNIKIDHITVDTSSLDPG